MAYVWPEDRIDNGVVMDPRPFNRTLGRYYAEFNGMLDKDNFVRKAVETEKVAPMTGTQGATESEMTGPNKHVKSWRSVTQQAKEVDDWDSNDAIRHFAVEGVGGTFATEDSGIIVEATVGYTWTYVLGDWHKNYVEFALLVDGIEVDATGPVGQPYQYWCAYLNGYLPVGAGIHTITLMCRIYYSYYNQTTHVSEMMPATESFYINNREVIAREARR